MSKRLMRAGTHTVAHEAFRSVLCVTRSPTFLFLTISFFLAGTLPIYTFLVSRRNSGGAVRAGDSPWEFASSASYLRSEAGTDRPTVPLALRCAFPTWIASCHATTYRAVPYCAVGSRGQWQCSVHGTRPLCMPLVHDVCPRPS